MKCYQLPQNLYNIFPLQSSPSNVDSLVSTSTTTPTSDGHTQQQPPSSCIKSNSNINSSSNSNSNKSASNSNNNSNGKNSRGSSGNNPSKVQSPESIKEKLHWLSHYTPTPTIYIGSTQQQVSSQSVNQSIFFLYFYKPNPNF